MSIPADVIDTPLVTTAKWDHVMAVNARGTFATNMLGCK
jgi:hypothetical protein